MQIQDDRTDEERRTHILVVGTDSFLSGWGAAEGGASYAAWACRYEDQYECERWVRARGDMKRVRICGPEWRPRGTGHAHIYVWRH